MAQSVDLPVSRWVRVTVAVFLLSGGLAIVTTGLVAAVVEWAGIVDNGFLPGIAASVVVYLVICAAWVWRTRGADGGSVWGVIPSSQYSGRHAESGGIARQEQEKALQELQERGETVQKLQDHEK